ncbi:MAG: AAA family ATPase [Candidatus Dojkabacteria bacterium]|nr:AAA family ATPase [Candidatus Dojkabacteria bacterium]
MDDTALINNRNSAQNDFQEDINLLHQKLSNSNVPPDLKEETLRAISRLSRIARYGNYSTEFETIDKYVDWISRIPWGVVTQDSYNIDNAKQIMDSTHYGMDTIKNLILDYLAVMELQNRGISNIIPEPVNLGDKDFSNPYNVPPVADNRVNATAKSPVLLFVGLQGVGKTSIAKSIAKAMGRKFSRISLGAIGDVNTIRGVPRYVAGAEPGQIIKSLIRTGSMNPVVLLDEIEKSSGQQGLLNDVMSALLEILDPEQNQHFIDHYIDSPVDLSNVFFICTANNLGGLSAALLDRVEIIRFTSYSDEEKEVIARRYILPKVLMETGLSDQHLQIRDEVWPLLIRPIGFDAGIRQLERNIYTLVRSVARKLVTGSPIPIVITNENVNDFVLSDQGTLS